MIEVKNIRKSFQGKIVLNDISATFEKGRTNMIIGASGTGKSVLLKTIVGLFSPDSGSVLYDGREFHSSTHQMQKQIRREIGMLFQGSALFDSMTVAENVRFPLNIHSDLSESEKDDKVNFYLKRVGLENAANKMPSEISGGMQKRVGIARAIVMNSQYLFCDEPNSGLDPQTAWMIDQLIHEITLEYNLTTVIVSHDMNSVMEIGEYIMFMFEGNKVWEGNKDTILDAEPKALKDFLFSNKLVRTFKGMQ
ncbi:ABC transporter ATP-binding protein [Flammeovirga kamogawensis]|uniref:ATP-binding cassette domain-containing protein n=1 Tax=Flammeovirga kamogawensis TaxID=373891 RepID=A0ABX8H1T9_9BACT|nr:ATP-binding cassette domain-containing protein [Flammeovirga kamogawensis]MBB6459560.1 phospholipid/cholesterol/gamma-HCH transport system ATP-binding protein [Flammeovirga kamogawensis]QWG09110.1 ATP-binding cassette domain-containing protein [Flammeovirga kamogawensis]TRX67398.1 ATP-binding cassette domain-containing protein [Flammeovirga kamogawensis]